MGWFPRCSSTAAADFLSLGGGGAVAPPARLINPLILVWSSCLLESQRASAAAHQHCGSLTGCWHIWTPFSSLDWEAASCQHDGPVVRPSDHWSDWAAAAGCAAVALLLYLQTGFFAAAGWTRQVLGLPEALLVASERWEEETAEKW